MAMGEWLSDSDSNPAEPAVIGAATLRGNVLPYLGPPVQPLVGSPSMMSSQRLT